MWEVFCNSWHAFWWRVQFYDTGVYMKFKYDWLRNMIYHRFKSKQLKVDLWISDLVSFRFDPAIAKGPPGNPAQLTPGSADHKPEETKPVGTELKRDGAENRYYK